MKRCIYYDEKTMKVRFVIKDNDNQKIVFDGEFTSSTEFHNEHGERWFYLRNLTVKEENN